VELLAKDIEKHGGRRENIRETSIDFSPSFTAGVTESFPLAQITYDRFHLIQMVNKALDEVRRKEAETNVYLKKSRFLWLRNPGDLKQEKKILLEDLKTKNVVLAKAYEMKENLRDLYNQETRALSEIYLDAWCELAESSGIQPMIQISKTLRRHRNGILSYIENKITSGVVEGLNSVIQSIKTRAR